ncbi:ribosome biogenesis GTP-binding protein YihA/YsxC [beta proteobacterium MWH-UniP1]
MSLQSQSPLPPLKDWIHQIAFLTSAAKSGDLPAIGAGEIAIAGRSNAGKSSALNTICNRRRLAFSSKTPGRTQLINLFTLQWQGEELGRLVDLPGYGYAAVDHATKARWQAELARFLDSRVSLVALILVMDIRHLFGPLDVQMLEWFGRRQQPIHVLLTKADKLTRNDQNKALFAAKKIIDEHASQWGNQVSVSLFSATSKMGRDEVLEKIGQWWGLMDKKNPATPSPGRNA